MPIQFSQTEATADQAKTDSLLITYTPESGEPQTTSLAGFSLDALKELNAYDGTQLAQFSQSTDLTASYRDTLLSYIKYMYEKHHDSYLRPVNSLLQWLPGYSTLIHDLNTQDEQDFKKINTVFKHLDHVLSLRKNLATYSATAFSTYTPVHLKTFAEKLNTQLKKCHVVQDGYPSSESGKMMASLITELQNAAEAASRQAIEQAEIDAGKALQNAGRDKEHAANRNQLLLQANRFLKTGAETTSRSTGNRRPKILPAPQPKQTHARPNAHHSCRR